MYAVGQNGHLGTERHGGGTTSVEGGRMTSVEGGEREEM